MNHSLFAIADVAACRSALFKIVFAFALFILPARAQFAPTSLAVPSFLTTVGTIIDSNYGLNSFNAVVEITSATAFRSPPSTGTYTYAKTGSNTGTLNYTSNESSPGYTYTETGTILLTFTSATGGTFTASGRYTENDAGNIISGTTTGGVGTFTYTHTDTAPTITNVTDKSTNEDTATTAIPFTIGDSSTDPALLTVTVSSSNTTLVPLTNLVLGGSGASRTVTITPAANQTGTSTITLNVSDGVFTTSDTFVLTVNPVNDAPTITDVINLSTDEDTATTAIPFTVGDVETAPSSLTVTRNSSNLTLLPLANVVLGGTGANRTVTLTPAPNQTGTSTVTLTVSDGALTATDTFILTVNPVNDAPTISDVTDKSTNEDTATTAIPFTLGDIDTALTSLTVTQTSSNTTLVPLANVVLGGTGANRTVTITPAANQSGTSTITLTVNDGVLTASDSFVLTVTPVNDAPTISDVINQTTNEDTATTAIPLTIGDLETDVNSLTLTANSSNLTLIPLANIVFGGSGASRTVTLTPATNQNGTSTITLTLSDGNLTASDTFILTVNAVNDTPTISDVTDKSTNEDTATTAIPFTVGDVDPAVTSLTVTANSSNLALVPLTNIVFGGSGASRTVTLTPAANQNGTSTITLTVSDGTLTASDTFILTVSAVNDAPTISDVSDLTVVRNSTASVLNFTVGDVETAASSLTVTRNSSNLTLVPLANVVLGGTGASRTVTVTPAANQIGSSTITLTVSDGALTASDTFVFTVIDGITLSSWRQTYFGNTANTGDGADLNDFDSDGRVNLMEYALGSLPKNAAITNEPVVAREVFSGQTYLTMTISKPVGITGITYVVEVSSTLNVWTSGAATTTVITDNATTLKVRDNTPTTGGPRYIRLKVIAP